MIHHYQTSVFLISSSASPFMPHFSLFLGDLKLISTKGRVLPSWNVGASVLHMPAFSPFRSHFK